MTSTHTAHARRRRMTRAATFSLVLTLAPVAMIDNPASAQGAVSALAAGAQGDAVRALQQALVNQGIPLAGGVDGVFGAGTVKAVKQFQARNGLNATGVVDEATSLALGLSSNPLYGLKQGATGDAVRQLQQRLIDLGISLAGGADGAFGPGTTTAVKQFQARVGYAKSGEINAATAVALGVATTPAAAPAPATSNGSGAASAGLKIGARGDAVKQLQQQLIAAGFAMGGGADGIFGALTANALGAFQQSAGLAVTRAADDATLNALSQRASGGGGSAPTSPLLGLKSGSRSDAVKQLQQALINAGVAVKGGADGVFGANTQSALKQYQQALGINASGVVDDDTVNAIAQGRTVTAGPTGMVGLKSGSLGDSVKSLQQALIKAGVNLRGGADGIFGPATSQALKSFQQSQGINPSGVVDDATVAALQNPKAPTTPTNNNGDGGYAVFGEKGTRVISLQSALVKAGIAVRGGVDGDFGAGTSAAVMDFQRAKGLSVTGKLNEATANALGLGKADPPPPAQPGTATFSIFPVQGRCGYADTFGYARSGGRAHLGTDIIAPAGNLIYAVADGRITKIYADYPGSLAGNGVQLTTADGTYYFYAHMTGINTGIAVGVPIKAGQVLGTVGHTGDTTVNHLHFEVHPKGGSAINSYQLLKAIDACSVTTPLPPV